MPSSRHLLLSRHGVYYFRLIIPRVLRTQLQVDQREIRLSLRTRDPAVANMQARVIRVKIDELFARLSVTMPNPTPPFAPMTYDLDFDPQTGRIKVSNIKKGEMEEATDAMEAAQRKLQARVVAAAPAGQHRLAEAPVSEVVEAYLVAYRETKVAISTYKRRRGHLGVFQEYFNNCRISAISRPKLTDYFDDLKYIPLQKDIRPEHRDRSLAKALEAQKALVKSGQPLEGLSPQTQAHYREAVSSLFSWCHNVGIVPANHATRESPRLTSYSKEVGNKPRVPYSHADLKRIFEHEYYRQARYKHPYQYWVPHIALFTGSRINEIAQLYTSDVYQEDGYWVFNFCRVTGDEEVNGQRVHRADIRAKNEASRRLTPIHPKLVDLGFLTFYDEAQREGRARLFPELRYTEKGGYGTRASRWYNEEFLRPKAGISDPHKVFHSFRHTLITELGKTLFQMPEAKMIERKDSLIKAIAGHKMKDVTFGHYLTEFHPQVTSVVLNALNWNLDLTPYLGMQASAPLELPEDLSSI